MRGTKANKQSAFTSTDFKYDALININVWKYVKGELQVIGRSYLVSLVCYD